MSYLSGWLRQVVAATAANLRGIPRRLDTTFVCIFGTAVVVGVFTSILSIAEGFEDTLYSSGSAETAVVLRAGSRNEVMSSIPPAQSKIVGDLPGVARTENGPIVSSELYVIADLPRVSTGTSANVPLRGVSPPGFDLRKVEIVEGRRLTPGKRELIVGRGAVSQFDGLEIGSELEFRGTRWPIVGIFAAGGSVVESEVWADVQVLQPIFERGAADYSVVYAKLESVDAFKEFQAALENDPRLTLSATRESAYFARQIGALYGMVFAIGMIITLIMGTGAVFSTTNMMYAAVIARTGEIALLRALGFSGGAVALSVLVESLLLGGVGTAFGAGFSYLVFDGLRTSTLSFQSFGQVVFELAVTPALLVRGVVLAMFFNFLGGLGPALRAARMPVLSALRET